MLNDMVSDNILNPVSVDFSNNTFRLPAKLFPDPVFLKDMSDLFMRRRAGHAVKHIFTGKAFFLWEEFTKAAEDYYPFRSDAELINKHAAEYGDLVRERNGDGGPVTVIELGPGSPHAVKNKTLPLLRDVKPTDYAVVDHSLEVLFTSMELIKNTYGHINRHFYLNNFDKDDLSQKIAIDGYNDSRYPRNGRRLMVQFGSTLGNVEGFLKGPAPHDTVVSSLKNFRRNLLPRDILVLGIDQNQDEQSLHACYSSPLNEEFAMATLRRVEQELDVSSGFDINNFDYTRFWHPENHLYGHGYAVRKDNAFYLRDEKAVLKAGEILSYANTYKYSQSFMDRAYEDSGAFRLLKVNRDERRRMSHQVLEAL